MLTAAELDTGLLTQAFNHAYAAVVVLAVIFKHLDCSSLIKLFNAVFIKARQALLFALKASAPVTASEFLVAALFLDLQTLFSVTAGLERGILIL